VHAEDEPGRGGDHGGGGDEPAQRVGEVAHHERHRDHEAGGGVQQHEGGDGRRGATVAREQSPGRSPEPVDDERRHQGCEPEAERDRIGGAVLVEPARLPGAPAREPLDVPHRERPHREQVGREGTNAVAPGRLSAPRSVSTNTLAATAAPP